MSAQENKSGVLLLAAVGALSILLGYRFLSFYQTRKDLIAAIDRIEQHVRDPAETALSGLVDADIPVKPDLSSRTGEPANWALNGLSFYELKEIDRFFVEKIQETGSSIEILPPRNLYGAPVKGGVQLVWSGNPMNQDAIKNLAGNPLLKLQYKIYRWTKNSQPEVVAVLSSQQEEYVDTNISPARDEYFYCVILALEGTSTDDPISIVSERSKVISVVSHDRFSIRVTGGNERAVFVSVTISDKFRSYTEAFTVEPGQQIGRAREIAGSGIKNFSTGLTLKSIRFIKETRQITAKIPVFNSDGSINIDHSTREPVYREGVEERPVQVISIECIDQNGQSRIFKES